MPTVLVSGCYDLLHAGHIAFFREAASYGKLYVSVGSDRNIELLKGKRPVFSEAERLYIVKAIRDVEDAFIGSGTGLLDFEPDLRRLKPDFLIVNEDGHAEEKRLLCESLGVTYKILKRDPAAGLPVRASSTLKKDLGL
jgi:cytidyltransferase-like protein